MPIILDGRSARDFYKKALIERVAKLPSAPCLSIIQIGNKRESNIYIAQKKKFGESIGAKVRHISMPEDVSFEDAAKAIKAESDKNEITGVILQSPLPPRLDFIKLVNLIDRKKDVDGLCDNPLFTPATAKGVMFLLDFYKVPITGEKTAVLGRSRLVGGPIAEAMKERGALVTVCHSKTQNTAEITRNSKIVVVAIGKPEFLDASFVSAGAIVIDVGINSLKGEKLEEELPKRKVAGDVDFASVLPLVSHISPVPGGVGPMTVLALFDNLVEASENFNEKNHG